MNSSEWSEGSKIKILYTCSYKSLIHICSESPIFFRVARAAYGEETYLVLDFVLKFVRLHVII